MATWCLQTCERENKHSILKYSPNTLFLTWTVLKKKKKVYLRKSNAKKKEEQKR